MLKTGAVQRCVADILAKAKELRGLLVDLRYWTAPTVTPPAQLAAMDLGRILRILTDVPATAPAEREPAQAPSRPAPAEEPAPKDA